MIRSTPQLAVDKAWLLYAQFRVAEMAPYLEVAERETSELAHVGETAVMRAFYLLMTGDIAGCIELAEAVCVRLEVDYPVETGGLHIVLGNAYAALGKAEKSVSAFSRAVKEMARGESWVGYSAAVLFLMRHHLESGRLERAYELGSRFMVRFEDDPSLQHAEGTQAGVYHALLIFEKRDNPARTAAVAHVEQALALAQLTPSEAASAIWMNLILALFKLDAGETAEADRHAADARAGLDSLPVDSVLVAYYELFARTYLARQQQAKVEYLFTQFDALNLPKDHPSARLNRVHRAELLLQKIDAQDRLEAAIQSLESTLTGTSKNSTQMRGLAVTALMHDRLGSHDQAQAAIQAALDLAAPQGWVAVFDFPGGQMLNLLRTVRPHSRQQPFIDKVLGLLAAGHSALSDSGYALIEPLSDRELEVLRLVADGYANKAIAERLHLAVGTVKRHLNNINGKLRTTSRTQAVARARAEELL
ncbi:MAG: LuxR C-terminal-related transcriptional regulator [Chloroflexota bacterium]